MNYYRKRSAPPMTAKQKSFIDALVDQFGYKDSPYRLEYLDHIGYHYININGASNRIDYFKQAIGLRKFSVSKRVAKDYIPTVQDLSQFVFCNASFSILNSILIEKVIDQESEEEDDENNIEEQSGESKLHESYLLRKLQALSDYTNGVIEIDSKDKYETQIKSFIDFIESELKFDGYSELSYGYNEAYQISGKPHLIFERKNGERILVVEKHTSKSSIPNILWDNNKVQALAYLYLFPEFNCSSAIVISWEFGNWKADIDRDYRLFRLYKSDENLNFLLQHLERFRLFLSEQDIDFDSKSINPKQCFSCDCLIYCNHKSGLIENISVPYSTPSYYKKYPLNYNYSELVKVDDYAHKEVIIELENSKDIEAWKERFSKQSLIRTIEIRYREYLDKHNSAKQVQNSRTSFSDVNDILNNTKSQQLTLEQFAMEYYGAIIYRTDDEE